MKKTALEVARDALDAAVEQALEGCGDPTHVEGEQAACAFLKAMVKFEVLPERVRDVVVRVLVTHAMHTKRGPAALVELLDPETGRIGDAMVLASAICRLYEQPAETAHNGVPLATGQYV